MGSNAPGASFATSQLCRLGQAVSTGGMVGLVRLCLGAPSIQTP